MSQIQLFLRCCRNSLRMPLLASWFFVGSKLLCDLSGQQLFTVRFKPVWHKSSCAALVHLEDLNVSATLRTFDAPQTFGTHDRRLQELQKCRSHVDADISVPATLTTRYQARYSLGLEFLYASEIAIACPIPDPGLRRSPRSTRPDYAVSPMNSAFSTYTVTRRSR